MWNTNNGNESSEGIAYRSPAGLGADSIEEALIPPDGNDLLENEGENL